LCVNVVCVSGSMWSCYRPFPVTPTLPYDKHVLLRLISSSLCKAMLGLKTFLLRRRMTVLHFLMMGQCPRRTIVSRRIPSLLRMFPHNLPLQCNGRPPHEKRNPQLLLLVSLYLLCPFPPPRTPMQRILPTNNLSALSSAELCIKMWHLVYLARIFPWILRAR
jgi:hypothetical protein